MGHMGGGGREMGEGGWKMRDRRWKMGDGRGEEVSDVEYMEAMSHGFEDFILDYPISIEETEIAVKKLKTRSGGADGLLAEHLKHGGHVLTLWLKRIFNLEHLEQDMASDRMRSVLEICTCALLNITLYSGRGRGGVGALTRYRPNSAAADGVGEDTKEEAKGKR